MGNAKLMTKGGGKKAENALILAWWIRNKQISGKLQAYRCSNMAVKRM